MAQKFRIMPAHPVIQRSSTYPMVSFLKWNFSSVRIKRIVAMNRATILRKKTFCMVGTSPDSRTKKVIPANPREFNNTNPTALVCLLIPPFLVPIASFFSLFCSMRSSTFFNSVSFPTRFVISVFPVFPVFAVIPVCSSFFIFIQIYLSANYLIRAIPACTRFE